MDTTRTWILNWDTMNMDTIDLGICLVYWNDNIIKVDGTNIQTDCNRTH